MSPAALHGATTARILHKQNLNSSKIIVITQRTSIFDYQSAGLPKSASSPPGGFSRDEAGIPIDFPRKSGYRPSTRGTSCSLKPRAIRSPRENSVLDHGLEFRDDPWRPAAIIRGIGLHEKYTRLRDVKTQISGRRWNGAELYTIINMPGMTIM